MPTIILAFLAGLLLPFAAAYLIYTRYLRDPKSPPREQFGERREYSATDLPSSLKDAIRQPFKEESCLWASLFLQFMFPELTSRIEVRNFVISVLRKELDKMMRHAAVRMLITELEIAELDLGRSAPVFTSARVTKADFDSSAGRFETLDVKLGIDYSGQFAATVNAALKVGGAASVSVCVRRLCGDLRLQLTQRPYAHWSASFIEEPTLELAVETTVKDKSFSHIAALLESQLRKTVRKKHTLPNYRVRFPPFFKRASSATYDTASTEQKLEKRLKEVAREKLKSTPTGTDADQQNVALIHGLADLPHGNKTKHVLLTVDLLRSSRLPVQRILNTLKVDGLDKLTLCTTMSIDEQSMIDAVTALDPDVSSSNRQPVRVEVQLDVVRWLASFARSNFYVPTQTLATNSLASESNNVQRETDLTPAMHGFDALLPALTGQIGATFKDAMNAELGVSFVFVESVVSRSIADMAGLKPRDSVLSVNQVAVASARQCADLIRRFFNAVYFHLGRSNLLSVAASRSEPYVTEPLGLPFDGRVHILVHRRVRSTLPFVGAESLANAPAGNAFNPHFDCMQKGLLITPTASGSAHVGMAVNAQRNEPSINKAKQRFAQFVAASKRGLFQRRKAPNAAQMADEEDDEAIALAIRAGSLDAASEMSTPAAAIPSLPDLSAAAGMNAIVASRLVTVSHGDVEWQQTAAYRVTLPGSYLDSRVTQLRNAREQTMRPVATEDLSRVNSKVNAKVEAHTHANKSDGTDASDAPPLFVNIVIWYSYERRSETPVGTLIECSSPSAIGYVALPLETIAAQCDPRNLASSALRQARYTVYLSNVLAARIEERFAKKRKDKLKPAHKDKEGADKPLVDPARPAHAKDESPLGKTGGKDDAADRSRPVNPNTPASGSMPTPIPAPTTLKSLTAEQLNDEPTKSVVQQFVKSHGRQLSHGSFETLRQRSSADGNSELAIASTTVNMELMTTLRPNPSLKSLSSCAVVQSDPQRTEFNESCAALRKAADVQRRPSTDSNRSLPNSQHAPTGTKTTGLLTVTAKGHRRTPSNASSGSNTQSNANVRPSLTMPTVIPAQPITSSPQEPNSGNVDSPVYFFDGHEPDLTFGDLTLLCRLTEPEEELQTPKTVDFLFEKRLRSSGVVVHCIDHRRVSSHSDNASPTPTIDTSSNNAETSKPPVSAERDSVIATSLNTALPTAVPRIEKERELMQMRKELSAPVLKPARPEKPEKTKAAKAEKEKAKEKEKEKEKEREKEKEKEKDKEEKEKREKASAAKLPLIPGFQRKFCDPVDHDFQRNEALELGPVPTCDYCHLKVKARSFVSSGPQQCQLCLMIVHKKCVLKITTANSNVSDKHHLNEEADEDSNADETDAASNNHVAAGNQHTLSTAANMPANAPSKTSRLLGKLTGKKGDKEKDKDKTGGTKAEAKAEVKAEAKPEAKPEAKAEKQQPAFETRKLDKPDSVPAASTLPLSTAQPSAEMKLSANTSYRSVPSLFNSAFRVVFATASCRSGLADQSPLDSNADNIAERLSQVVPFTKSWLFSAYCPCTVRGRIGIIHQLDDDVKLELVATLSRQVEYVNTSIVRVNTKKGELEQTVAELREQIREQSKPDMNRVAAIATYNVNRLGERLARQEASLYECVVRNDALLLLMPALYSLLNDVNALRTEPHPTTGGTKVQSDQATSRTSQDGSGGATRQSVKVSVDGELKSATDSEDDDSVDMTYLMQNYVRNSSGASPEPSVQISSPSDSLTSDARSIETTTPVRSEADDEIH